MLLCLPIQLSEDVLSEFVVGLEVTSFMLSDHLVKVGIDGYVVLHELSSEVVDVQVTLGVVLDSLCHSLLESML